MGSILNFIKLPNVQFNGEGLVVSPPDNIPLFHLSIFENWLINTDYEISNEYKDGRKNIFYIECFEGLTNFYKKDVYSNKSILDTLPTNLLEKISNGDCKILLTSLSEATEFTNEILLDIENELKRFDIKNENLIIIESNFRYVENITPFKIFGSNHFFVHSASTFDLINNNTISDLGYPIAIPTIFDSQTIKRKKHFLCFMRNTQKFHRHYLLLYLIHEKILDKCIVSAIRKIDKQYSIDTQGEHLGHLTKYVDEANNMIPIEIDTHGIDDKMGFSALNCYRTDEYLNSYIHLVTETTYEDDKLFFTEKISKPIIGLQPFIVFSNNGYLKKLKEFGFKTFDTIIDESYDDEPDIVKRFLLTTNEVQKLSVLSIDDLHKLYISALDICIYNRNHLQKMYKEDMMLQTLKVIENEW
jgi:hypothetical protein